MTEFPLIVGTLLFSLVMFVCGGYIWLRDRRWRAQALTAAGKVVRIEGDRPGEPIQKGRRVFPVVQYTSVDGREHERRSPNGSRPGSVAVGDELTVFYQPDRAYAGRVDTGAVSTKAVAVALGLAILGVLWLVTRLAF